MARCIFCKKYEGPFNTCEHILPESLGGGDWAVLPPGLYCDLCQNRFGSAIEQQALADYPFSMLRVFLGIPTKKKKAPWFDSWEGRIEASPVLGQIGYEPSPFFRHAFEGRRKSQIRLLAEPRKPAFVCRTLLKMAIETVAADDPMHVFSERFDEARHFALYGVKDKPWWYLQVEDLEQETRFFTGKPLHEDYVVGLETIPLEDGAEVFHLQLFYLQMFCPLESRIIPPSSEDLHSPAQRLFWV